MWTSCGQEGSLGAGLLQVPSGPTLLGMDLWHLGLEVICLPPAAGCHHTSAASFISLSLETPGLTGRANAQPSTHCSWVLLTPGPGLSHLLPGLSHMEMTRGWHCPFPNGARRSEVLGLVGHATRRHQCLWPRCLLSPWQGSGCSAPSSPILGPGAHERWSPRAGGRWPRWPNP